MSDPVSLLQLIVAVLVAAVAPSAVVGAALWRMNRVEADVKENTDAVKDHGERIVALERDAHAARGREQTIVAKLGTVEAKLDGMNETLIRIEANLERDDKRK